MNTKELYKFLGELQANNNRPWFMANKERWDDLRHQWMDDVDTLLAKMSRWEPRFAKLSAKDCVFRIYRDVRFKTDKTPYKTWVCAGINIYGRSSHNGGYYVQCGPDSSLSDAFSGLFGGVWLPETPLLHKLRKAIVDNIEEFSEIIHSPQIIKHFPEWTGPKLKKLPKGYNPDPATDELLKLKEFGKACHCDARFFQGDWTSRASERLEILKPLVDFLNYSIEEE